MQQYVKGLISLGVILCGLSMFTGCGAPEATSVAPTPPMGWNSFDAYGAAINEQQFRDCVEYMADNLLEYGWDYAVVDYCWYNPAPGMQDLPNMRRPFHPNLGANPDGSQFPELAVDEYGRLQPHVKRFPSAANGQGFKPLADWVHSKGLKFGIHIMRGVARQVYRADMPIKGSNATAQNIAVPSDTCVWLNYMYGVDMTKDGAQEYYDSLFEQYAEWGVDFVKVDDISKKIDIAGRGYGALEIEAIQKAIQKCGRPMVLSLSPGETPLVEAEHVTKWANMWRCSGDLWDGWEQLHHAFDLAHNWEQYSGPGSWPDQDMLPLGHLSMGGRPHGPDRWCELTKPEQITMMSLWSICRSPLMWGGDPVSNDAWTLSLLTNEEVLAVNQASANNRQLFRDSAKTIWVADVPNSADKYVALFNMSDEAGAKEVSVALADLGLSGSVKVRDLWQKRDLGAAEGSVTASVDRHSAVLYRVGK
jgi:alpha-galactosidase